MLSFHLEVAHANSLVDSLEEEEARYANAKRDYKSRIDAIAVKKEDNIMKRGAKAIEYAVSVLIVIVR